MASKASVAQPAPAKLKTRSEFSVTLEVAPSASASWYRYEYKEAGSNWEQNALRVDAAPGASEVILDDLNPTSTYEVRIYEVSKDENGREQVSAPSAVAAVDTEVPGCGPQQSQGCMCTIQ
ncbi:hypothetical protein PHYBOEH_009906 [Phytophthora boehmeriae]|uniref:Fibronectin type-III domain-containing protein n=1 Tax=Phytophthora boehmeriae TaxID=109152 RepID=A0A8T1WZI7_9STRA|nr:hypothetical protein PHYBOEH_009906 [Phytophthora boehmeriae]